MRSNLPPQALALLEERFGHDCLISVATLDGQTPCVRTVNAFYQDGAFYVLTHALSGKMKQIAVHPIVGVCGEWFTGHGIAENLGHPCDARNEALAARMRSVFSSWYFNGHVDESDPGTCILCIRLTNGVLLSHGTRYDLDFTD